MNDYNLVFIAWHSCSRVLREAMALRLRGHNITYLSHAPLDNRGLFNQYATYANEADLVGYLSLLSDKYIFHVHNEPSWMVSTVRRKFPKAKIVFDLHDSNYWRQEGVFEEEDKATSDADALVFPSEMAKDAFPHKKESIVLPSAHSKNMFIKSPQTLEGIVSVGGHKVPDGGMNDSWRDYTKLYTELSKYKKIKAYCPEFFNGIDSLDEHYSKLVEIGVETSGGVLKAMSRYEWSLVGNLEGDVWKVALPNKMFDSMTAGVPVVNFNCPEVGKIIDKYDVGINVSSVDELVERWGEHKEKRKNVLRHRDKLTMERYIKKLEKLYEKLAFDGKVV